MGSEWQDIYIGNVTENATRFSHNPYKQFLRYFFTISVNQFATY